jgi:hypothetical protein
MDNAASKSATSDERQNIAGTIAQDGRPEVEPYASNVRPVGLVNLPTLVLELHRRSAARRDLNLIATADEAVR